MFKSTVLCSSDPKLETRPTVKNKLKNILKMRKRKKIRIAVAEQLTGRKGCKKEDSKEMRPG